ncbi:hypothetical protein [Actinokineospora pegani]|uniref:hypothetical protein n=1 Tax=Actinokineospora pegani TaxID=2654637 RepID=UPI0012EA6474|nr:hypothetical protein [Actinokineospora pegani]
MRLTADTPRTVLGAGVLISLQGLVALVFTVALVVQAIAGGSPQSTRAVLGEVVYFIVVTAGVLACGVGLILGKTWSRGPSIVVQVLLLGAAWYAIGPSSRPEIGAPVAVVCLVALVLLFRSSTTRWAQGDAQE